MGCIPTDNSHIVCQRCNMMIPRGQTFNHVCRINNQSIQTPNYQKKQEPGKYLQQSSANQHNNHSNQINTPRLSQPFQNPFVPFLKPIYPPEPNKFQMNLYRGEAREFPNQYIDIKKPRNPDRTIFSWEKQKTMHYPLSIKLFKSDILRFRTFQQKMLWFRLNIQSIRISWQKGCQTLEVDRGNLIKSSLIGLKNKNLRKQLKIKFDDQVVDDAGGLERQWMYLVTKEVFTKTFIFQLCDTQQTAYKIRWDKSIDQQTSLQHIEVLGMIIGKALFDRIPLNCYLNRTIWRQITSQPVLLPDVFSFDKQFYNSWKMILETEGAEELYLNFSEVKTFEDKSSQVFDLVKDGRDIQVNDKNKPQYIYQLMNLYCVRSVKKEIAALKSGIQRVIPPDFLKIFQPYEIQMLLNGPRNIDLKDWRQNTVYKGYQPNDQVIIWFWNVVSKFDQKHLENLLHYCTGSSSVPILGFKYLESNRNTINKFTIQKVALCKDNPYPKSYTCFNRLELPQYGSMSDLQKNLSLVIKQEITSFGLG